ncbi:MAG: hypothetical protein C7B43_19900 [Sulfobacillus benefaciens]|jgi:hypothetical protein|uniref:Uncharacterized protein n=1 Tax=Sulfobacillus benefaciens TaxID=453960 RepID=A0A2T2WMX1_9FIRM|nr:MAG: hypothetical protein C7B43_19900 [Sulfobacillus benefaciens]HBQ94987.1 hypothetical protein [Sulfobacillus sp.]
MDRPGNGMSYRRQFGPELFGRASQNLPELDGISGALHNDSSCYPDAHVPFPAHCETPESGASPLVVYRLVSFGGSQFPSP